MSLGNVEYSSSNYYHRAFSEKFTSDETTSDFLYFEFTSDGFGSIYSNTPSDWFTH